MNKNIEIINKNLWAVNYHHLMYMNDLDFNGNLNDALENIASFTNDGIIILNKSHELYPSLKQFMQKIMNNSNDELKGKVHYMQGKDRDGYDRVYKFCLDAEIKRRVIEKDFTEQSKSKPLIKRILKFIGFNSKERM